LVERWVIWPLFAALMGFALGGSVVWSQQPASHKLAQAEDDSGKSHPGVAKAIQKVAPDQSNHADQDSSTKNWSKIFLDHLPDWFVALFTAVLSIFTGLLWWSTNKLWKAGERQIGAALKAATAADLSARAAIGIELPIIRIVPDELGSGSRRDGDEMIVSYSVHGVTFVNLGRTKAFPIEIKSGMTCGSKLPDTPNYTEVDTFLPNIFFEADPEITPRKTFFECSVIIHDGDADRVYKGEIGLWFYCCLTYDDFMQTRRTVAFCWQWTRPGIKQAWRPDGTPAYNQKTQSDPSQAPPHDTRS
jgi:hypothetical protein